jgi:hypothetical protein
MARQGCVRLLCSTFYALFSFVDVALPGSFGVPRPGVVRSFQPVNVDERFLPCSIFYQVIKPVPFHYTT